LLLLSEETKGYRGVVVTFVPGLCRPVRVGAFCGPYASNQLARALVRHDVQQGAPVEESELVDRRGGTVGKQGSSSYTFRSVERGHACNGLKRRLGVCGGNPIAVRLVGVLVLLLSGLADPGSMAGRANGPRYQRCVTDTCNRLFEPVVSDNRDLAAVVQHKRTVTEHKIFDVVSHILEKANCGGWRTGMAEIAIASVIAPYHIDRGSKKLCESGSRHCSLGLAKTDCQMLDVPSWTMSTTAIEPLWLCHPVEHTDKTADRERVVLVGGATGRTLRCQSDLHQVRTSVVGSSSQSYRSVHR
jgi:hypothetical protein